ncbi:OmpA family protein [Stenotrophomonas maltophilia]|uniref:OmpA family protein n=1 Tax=Stenotrophomonas maltophilia TaxID=40324 RepID=UPI0039C14E69
MSAYDRFIEDAATRLELGHRTRWVVEVITAWVASHPHGLDGVQQRFEQAGLAARFHSWRHPATLRLPIVASEMERALGAHTLAMVAHRSGMSPGPFRVVICHLLPGVVALMSAPHTADQVATAPVPARRNAAPRRMRSMVPSRAMYGMALRSLLWTVAVVAVLGLTTWLLVKARTPLWTMQDIPRPHEAQLSLQQRGTQVQVHGRLPSESDRRRVWNALSAVHGARNLDGGIALDPNTQAPRWLDRLVVDLPHLRGDGLHLAFDGTRLRIDTRSMQEPERLAISRRLRQDFPALEMSGLWGPGLAALAQLPPDAVPAQRVAALNQTTLKFRAGSSELTGDSRQTLEAVANALRDTPAGTRVEIGAHTDSRGQAEGNLHLSQQRAEAVSQGLQALGVEPGTLVAVGYGQEHPVADNRSDSGRAQNRRIGYRLLD